jgi:hypothetical protein
VTGSFFSFIPAHFLWVVPAFSLQLDGSPWNSSLSCPLPSSHGPWVVQGSHGGTAVQRQWQILVWIL